MAKRRTLKRDIGRICAELFAESVASSLYGPGNSTENNEALFFSIVKLQRHYLSRVDHVEPGMNPKQYFKDLKEKFNAEVDDIVSQMNSL